MTILYADDDPEDREIFCEALQQVVPSALCTFAIDGKEALEKLQNSGLNPDFIFLDINMPLMTGEDCLINLKKDERYVNTPVIIYSTTSDKEEMRRMIKLGAQDFLVKPPSFKIVKEQIQKVFSKQYSKII